MPDRHYLTMITQHIDALLPESPQRRAAVLTELNRHNRRLHLRVGVAIITAALVGGLAWEFFEEVLLERNIPVWSHKSSLTQPNAPRLPR